MTRNSGGRSRENKEARSDLVVCVFAVFAHHVLKSIQECSADFFVLLYSKINFTNVLYNNIYICTSPKVMFPYFKKKIKKYVLEHTVG